MDGMRVFIRSSFFDRIRIRMLPISIFLIVVSLKASDVESFERTVVTRSKSLVHHSSRLNVLLDPLKEIDQVKRQRNPYAKHRNRRKGNFKKKRTHSEREDVKKSERWSRAIKVEERLLKSLEGLETSIKGKLHPQLSMDIQPIDSLLFPGIRECNAALATFGDGGDILRALRLYFKMRKAASLSKRYFPREKASCVPIPTLVTFSTLMSRAVQSGKPLVAVRLWKIMRQQIDFFSNPSSVRDEDRIYPDIKAANILMNCYAKLGYVKLAQDLLDQMIAGGGHDVPQMSPNLVTFNTLLDTCQKAGDLDTALLVKKQLEDFRINPDTRTYTTLIATVAREASSANYGSNDPTLAFSLLQEMQSLDIRPNGMTYSAIIDVCSRCRRSDLALKGLRLMQDQKQRERDMLDLPPEKRHTLPTEVGAWTAAINACGRTGKIESALKLFYSMTNFGVYPNTVTCGCITDCLLREGRTADSLSILHYMKEHRIAPSEVMYTSLMTYAGRLAECENSNQSDADDTSAVKVYTELMTSLLQLSSKKGSSASTPLPLWKKPRDNTEQYRVSLVFQEMKTAGVEPDLACYNALLKSCANAGDVERASEILSQIQSSDDLNPNDNTWRQIIRAAGKANRIDVALSTWKVAIKEMDEAESVGSREAMLSAKSAVALLESLIQGSNDTNLDRYTQLRLFQLVSKVCEAVISGSSYLGMNLVDRPSVLRNPRAMITFLQALVALENESKTINIDGNDLKINQKKSRLLAVSIVASNCFQNGLPYRLQQYPPYVEAYNAAQRWLGDESCRM